MGKFPNSLVIVLLALTVTGCSSRTQPALKQPESIRIEQPPPNRIIRSPLTITGSARGSWYFEGDFTAKLLTDNGRTLGTGILTAQSSWMSSDFVRFEGRLIFENPEGDTNGRLLFQSANPSGRPEYQKTAVVPVRFSR